MTSGHTGSGNFGRDPFGEFIARFLGPGASGGSGGGRGDPRYFDFLRLMSEPARQLISDAASYAAQHGSSDLDTEHVLRAALNAEPTRSMVERAGADPDRIAAEIDSQVGDGPARTSIAVSPAVKRALLDAHDVARSRGASYIGSEHVLVALAANQDSTAGQILSAARFDPGSAAPAAGHGAGQGAGAEAPAVRGPQPREASKTPNLDKYGRDLTALAAEGRIDPVIGRDEQIEQSIEILARRGKNNPVLIGEAGVGKTAIVEGLAQRIVDGDIPHNLLGRRVVQLDFGSVVAGTRYRGDFEERLRGIIDEIRERSEELVVFIDELHTVVGAGGGGSEGGSMDASNMLKPALSRGELHVIGATTLDEHRRHIEKDAALARRFQPVLVPEPDVADAVEILRGLRDRYEAHHQVRYSDEALMAAVEMSDRYLTGRYLPDKAIDLIDQAGARVRLRSATRGTDVRALEREAEQVRRDKDQAVAAEDYERATQLRDRLTELESQIGRDESRRQPSSGGSRIAEVGVEDIAEIVSRQTGIPVQNLTQEEKDRLLNLEEHLRRRVIGQDEAVGAVADAVLRSRAGLASPDRPIGSFLFLGPTGVGKTELARALAEALFGSDDRMNRLDMSEFQERHTVSRLVGAPPGYVGHEEAGQLTEAVRRNPYSLLLLDEIEKAHPDVFNMLLQVLDDGRLTDAQGRTVDFTNTVIVMTSNLGSEAVTGRGALGFGTEDAERAEDARRERILRPLREHFRPEFLNRIDEVVIFRQLSDEQLRQITDMMLEETRRRVHAQDLTVEFAPAAVDWLARHGYQPEYGARPLRRTIQREVDNQLSRMLLGGEVEPHSRLLVDVEEDRLTFRPEAEASAPAATG